MAVLLFPCLDALNDAVDAATVPVAVVSRNVRHPLATKAHPDPDLDASVVFLLDQSTNPFLNVLTPGPLSPSNLLIALGPFQNSENSFPQSISAQHQAAAQLVKGIRKTITEARGNLAVVHAPSSSLRAPACACLCRHLPAPPRHAGPKYPSQSSESQSGPFACPE